MYYKKFVITLHSKMTCTETVYIESAEGLKIRLDRIILIIEALEIRSLEVVDNSDVEEYAIDDGQVKIRTLYRSSKQIYDAIEAYERLKQKILNKLNGRDMVLRPWQGLR